MAHAAGAWPARADLICARLICSATEAGKLLGRFRAAGVTIWSCCKEDDPAAAAAEVDAG